MRAFDNENYGRRRVVIEGVIPEINGGQFPIKRTSGEAVQVEADVFADGHGVISAVLMHRHERVSEWSEVSMRSLPNDRWQGTFTTNGVGVHLYTIEGWVDPVKSWQRDMKQKLAAGQDVAMDAQMGAELIEAMASRAPPHDVGVLRARAQELRTPGMEATVEEWLGRWGASMAEFSTRYRDREMVTRYHRELSVVVDPQRARFSAWYELFPRSWSATDSQHGTLKDVADNLPRIAAMGFNVLYLPPIHPIGQSSRKGRNNQENCQAEDPGSPWAIGARTGGHKAVHPELGSLDDFRKLVELARSHGIEIALDIALQCSPDHPYVGEHPEWFRKRPDGTIQYAENPPKKYQDIVPFDFECVAWHSLWTELRSVFEFWIEQGVRIFRVDNPHTKSLVFWEWCLSGLKDEYPDLIFLAEAFTRPKVMYRLAKLGFTQSYNYFPWRNDKEELMRYFTELGQAPLADYFRPNLWPNTPDILPHYLQAGGRAAFVIRLILAATLGASYGIYGPVFEACEGTPREPESEEYLNSEKYEIRHWQAGASYPLQDLIAKVNRIRAENRALQFDRYLSFVPIDNERMLAYTKSTPDGTEAILTVVNLDPHHVHRGWIEFPSDELGVDANQTYQAHDLLTGARFLWRGRRNFIELDPEYSPAHIFRLRQRVRTERDFDYFM